MLQPHISPFCMYVITILKICTNTLYTINSVICAYPALPVKWYVQWTQTPPLTRSFTWPGTPPVMCYIHLNRNTTSDVLHSPVQEHHQCCVTFTWTGSPPVMCYIHLYRNTTGDVLHSPVQEHHQWCVTFTWTGSPPVMCYIHLYRNTTSDVLQSP